MGKTFIASMLLGAVLAACSDAGSFAIEITFPDQQARQETRSVRVVALDAAEGGTCAALVDGQAAPGDEGYPVEDEVEVDLDAGGAQGLDLEEKGPKLFYAEGLDEASLVILRGCAPVTADGSVNRVVTIALAWAPSHCRQDADCDDQVDCTADSCDVASGACSHTPDDGACDDGAFCNGSETCDPDTGCQAGVDPCDDLIDCTQDSCDEDADACGNQPDDSACDDLDACTGTETCDPITGCQAGEPLECDDGVFCNGPEGCDPDSGCVQGLPPTCDDGIGCTNDSCDQDSDQCEFVPNPGGCPEIHIGPADDTCPHDLPDGTPVTTCDYIGTTGVQDAADAAPWGGAVFVIHDDEGQATWYQGPVDLPGRSWIGAAPGVEPDHVWIVNDRWIDNGALRLTGNNDHVDGLSLVIAEDNEFFISARPTEDDHANATTGHLIERVRGFAVDQEVIGSNSIGPPVAVGDQMTVRNCHFYGFIELRIDVTGKQDVRFVHNTFVAYQAYESAIDVSGSTGFVFANNVVLSLAQAEPVAIVADLAATDMTITGNLLEGFVEPATGYNPGDSSVVVADNTLSQAELEAPSEPIFLADSAQAIAGPVPGEGTSLDGVDIDGLAGVLPGAYQQRSAQTLPRSTRITVGRGDCGGAACDVDADEVDQEIQQAVWRAWPHSDVEIYPSAEAYAGMAVIGWPLRLMGMGAAEDEVVLRNYYEDDLLEAFDIYDRHDASFIVLQHIEGPVIIQDMTLQLDSTGPGDNYAVFTEDRMDEADREPHRFVRLKLTTLGTEGGMFSGFNLGARAQVYDSLILGGYRSCVSWGPRSDDAYSTRASDAKVVNLTCRMIGTGPQAPREFFDVASVDGAVILNVVADAGGSYVPLFRAQRRSSGDVDPLALDLPTRFAAQALSIRGVSDQYDGFTDAEGDYTVVDLELLSESDPMFAGVGDSMLDPACTAIDTGVSPASIDPDLQAGRSLNGVDRAGRQIDRGCYEQGQ